MLFRSPTYINSSGNPGMATAGRIRHHLKHNLWNPLNSLIFIGYQAEGSLGRILLNGAKKVKLLGEEINVALEIYDLEGFSAHADQKMLIKWLSRFSKKPKKVFLVHGEEESSKALSDIIENELNIETIIPSIGDKINIEKDYVEMWKSTNMSSLKLKEDIENELGNVYNKFDALFNRTDDIYDDKVLEKNYHSLKNKLIEIQGQLMDLNILISK